jgi:hypothetical protein
MLRGLLWFLLTWLALPVVTAASSPVAVVSPRPGEALQGVVTISGSSAVDGFTAMEVSFAYSSDTGRTWFLIQESQQPVSGGALATWDTTTITDGDYDLRLLVSLKDGTQQQVLVKGLRVRNYTPVEASTPTVTPRVSATPRPTLAPSGTPTRTPIPLTATPLPPNPAQLTRVDYFTSLVQGGAIVLVLFLALGIYLGIKALLKR